MPQIQNQQSWHSISLQSLKEKFNTDLDQGLLIKSAAERLGTYGPNSTQERQERGIFSIIFGQFKNPLILVLAAAGVISYMLDERTDATVIAITVLVNTIIGVLQEGRASRAFSKLQEHIKRRAVVVRSGLERGTDSEEIVPGDVIVLRAGDSVPADARIISAHTCKVNESTLTGEWIAVDKAAGDLPQKTHLTERSNMVWAGTLVEEGTAHAVVVNTGRYTEFGKISLLVGETHKIKTPLQRNVADIARTISIFVLVVVVSIFALGIARGESYIEMFVTSVAIAVAAVPEGLPVAVTVILALGMERILRRGGLVKKLMAAETLGSTSIILTDKTGTLTQANMQVSDIITASHILDEKPIKKMPNGEAANILALRIGVLTADAFIENPDADFKEWIVRGTPTNRALLLAGIQAGLHPRELLRTLPRVDFLPFESERRSALSLHKAEDNSKILYAAGSPEFILASSKELYIHGKSVKITKSHRELLRAQYESATGHGARMLAVGFRPVNVSKISADGRDMVEGLVFVGFIGFHDPLRPNVKDSILLAKEAGLRPIIATGDHRLTAKKIAEEIGLSAADSEIMEGAELDVLAPEDLAAKVSAINVYARVLPHQKLRIVEAWQSHDMVVAMTGDGVNDAPALKKADIGVALGSGTEVAKEAADFVLLDDSFPVLVSAIEEGRVILDNLRKVLTFLFATGFTEIILVGGSLLFGFPLPLLASHILWINLVGEGFLNFAFAFEPKEDDVMKQRPSKKGARIFTREMWSLILIVGIATDLLLLGVFFYLFLNGYGLSYIRTIMFAGLGVSSLFFVFSLRSLRRPLWKIRFLSNPFLIGAFLTSFVLLICALTIPGLRSLLGLVPLTFGGFGLIVLLSIMNLLAIEAGKWMFVYRRN